jgi:hypothetical protein
MTRLHPFAARLGALVCLAGAGAAAAQGIVHMADPRDAGYKRTPGTAELVEREGVAKLQPDALKRREVFTVGDMRFVFVDATASGQFIRRLDGSQREATVRVEAAKPGWPREFLLRADCREATSYFGPVAGPVALKPVDASSVGGELYKELCTG